MGWTAPSSLKSNYVNSQTFFFLVFLIFVSQIKSVYAHGSPRSWFKAFETPVERINGKFTSGTGALKTAGGPYWNLLSKSQRVLSQRGCIHLLYTTYMPLFHWYLLWLTSPRLYLLSVVLHYIVNSMCMRPKTQWHHLYAIWCMQSTQQLGDGILAAQSMDFLSFWNHSAGFVQPVPSFPHSKMARVTLMIYWEACNPLMSCFLVDSYQLELRQRTYYNRTRY